MGSENRLVLKWMRWCIGLLISFNCFSQGNYFEYHKLINKAEEQYFIKSDIDSTFYFYNKVFTSYNFVFVKDLVNAAQIAYFCKKPYRQYLEQGFEYGLKIDHIRYIPLFKTIYKQLSADTKLKKIYSIKRRDYLSRIDVNYLDYVYTVGFWDQRGRFLDRKVYEKRKKSILITLTDSIVKKGFPGDRLIGIADSTIFRQLGSKKPNFYDRVKPHKELWDYFSCNEQELTEKMMVLVLINNFSSYYKLKEYWLTEIKKGNIHPRDVALLHDNTYRSSTNPGFSTLKGVYHTNPFVSYGEKWKRKDINKMRHDLFMVAMEVDEKKKEYEKKHGFKLFWGFWNCR
ncbi:hypothetical protein [Flavobacterium sp. WV_118_3]